MQPEEQNIENYFESEVQLIIFLINNVEYAIDIKNIIEIIQLMPISPLPNSPGFIEGVINLRGKVIPVVDLRARFQSPERKNTRRTKIMIAFIQDKEIGLIADSVTDVIGLSARQIEPPLPVIHGLRTEFIKGIAKLKKRLIIIADIEKILTTNEKIILKEKMDE